MTDYSLESLNSSFAINGALFTNVAYGAGTGVIDSFVRLQNTGDENGFNTSLSVNTVNNALGTDMVGGNFTRDLLLSDVPIIYVNGQAYREFRLDINQTNNSPLLSLDALKIYQTTSGGLTDVAGLNPVYNMDANGDNTVLLNYTLQPGSGVGDASVLIADSVFKAAGGNYVTLYSEFGYKGGNYASNDGFEEWSVGVGGGIAKSAIAGIKFLDTNGDGLQDNGEGGLGGVKVFLDLNHNGSFDWTDANSNGTWDPGEGDQWTVTAAGTGAYSFNNLAAGLGTQSTYTVREVVPAGYTETAPLDGTYATGVGSETSTASNFGITVELKTAGVTYALPGFGNTQYASLSGHKYEDMNGNGVQDAGDNGLSGWTIHLLKGGVDTGLTATTDANGFYQFTNLVPGDYSTKEDLKSGWYQTAGSTAETLTSGENDTTGNDFLNTQYASLSGHKYEDLNGNGVQDAGDNGLSGWTIHLLQGGVDTGLTATTDANGFYQFTGLKPGDYSTTEDLKSGWYQTHGSTPETLTSGENDTTGNDFLNAQYASLSGHKYQDMNGNGVQDAGDNGLSGWTIHLLQGGVDTGLTATTDANGFYQFTGLKAGDYSTKEDLKSGWYQTAGSTPETLTSGENDTTGNDFLNTQYASLSGHKYEDLNGNGVQDAGDNGLSGWTIHLLQGGVDTGLTATTDANGFYQFTGLKPGDYSTTEDLKSGWYQTAGSTPETLTSGENDTTGNDFLNTQYASLSGHKFNDVNMNGVWDSTESGLGGWTIELYKDGVKVTQTTTAADGSYSFNNLVAGNYSTKEVLQTGWVQTLGSTPETLTSGENDTAGNDFGNYRLENGTAQTPGFWKAWPQLFNQETHETTNGQTAELPPNILIDTPGGDETYFGVNALGSKSVSFLDALSANGGGESAFLRASAAAFANAASDEINYQIDEYQLKQIAGTSYAADLTILQAIDTNHDDHISVSEIKTLVADIYTTGGTWNPTQFTPVAAALDAMNNMHHLDSSVFV